MRYYLGSARRGIVIPQRKTAGTVNAAKRRCPPKAKTGVSPKRFLCRVVEAAVTFDLEQGRVTGLVIHQGGQDINFQHQP
jgi:hypothetical protein